MPSIDALLSLLLAALPLMGSPGPATLSLAAAGAAFGPRRSAPYWLGIVLGTTGCLLLIATGLAGLAMAAPGLAPAVSVAAAAYILYLAWRIAAAPPLSDTRRDAPPPAFLAGFLLAIANPKAYAAIGATYASVALDAAVKIAILTGVILLVNGVWLALGAALARRLRSPRASRALNIGFALLLLGSVTLGVLR